MLTGHSRRLACLFSLTGLVAGCAQTDNIIPRRTTLGSLKTSVSQLEYQNEQLRNEVVQLKDQNREIEDRLVQEQADNGDLAARLDDARHELSQRGIDIGEERASASTKNNGGASDSGVTIPAGRSTRKRRKPPFVQIPNREEVPAPDQEEQEQFTPPMRIRSRDKFGPQGNNALDDQGRWLPVAKGTTESSSTVR